MQDKELTYISFELKICLSFLHIKSNIYFKEKLHQRKTIEISQSIREIMNKTHQIDSGFQRKVHRQEHADSERDAK